MVYTTDSFIGVLSVDKIKNFLTEFYSDSDAGKGKQFKYGRQLVREYTSTVF